MSDFVNTRKDVFKRIHKGGAETCVKTVDSISTEKSTVFISSSVGCPLKCKFCHLTLKGHKYSPLKRQQIIENTVDTVNWAGKHNSKILSKNLKLSWMGMGDAFFNLKAVLEDSDKILARCEVKGLDKIDISTALPNHISLEDFDTVKQINSKYGENVRWFYSLFSTIPETRYYMVPNTHSVTSAIGLFREAGIKVIAHQIFLGGVNDSDQEVAKLIETVNTNKDVFVELRVLRYNECENSWWRESSRLPGIMQYIETNCAVKVKSQVSPGKEIQAACGMFHSLNGG